MKTQEERNEERLDNAAGGAGENRLDCDVLADELRSSILAGDKRPESPESLELSGAELPTGLKRPSR